MCWLLTTLYEKSASVPRQGQSISLVSPELHTVSWKYPQLDIVAAGLSCDSFFLRFFFFKEKVCILKFSPQFDPAKVNCKSTKLSKQRFPLYHCVPETQLGGPDSCWNQCPLSPGVVIVFHIIIDSLFKDQPGQIYFSSCCKWCQAGRRMEESKGCWREIYLSTPQLGKWVAGLLAAHARWMPGPAKFLIRTLLTTVISLLFSRCWLKFWQTAHGFGSTGDLFTH